MIIHVNVIRYQFLCLKIWDTQLCRGTISLQNWSYNTLLDLFLFIRSPSWPTISPSEKWSETTLTRMLVSKINSRSLVHLKTCLNLFKSFRSFDWFWKMLWIILLSHCSVCMGCTYLKHPTMLIEMAVLQIAFPISLVHHQMIPDKKVHCKLSTLEWGFIYQKVIIHCMGT